MAVKEKIRIRLKGYDHQLVDTAAEKNKTVEALQGLELPAGVEIEIKL